MLGFFTKRRTHSSPPARRWARLSLESLEARDTPTTTTLNVAQAGGHHVALTGLVTDSAPAGLVVTFTGVVSGQTTTNANGSFQVTLNASALGNITATVTGADGTANATSALTNVAATITNFTAVNDGNNYWTFTGTVSDEYVAGLTVTLAGGPAPINGHQIAVNSDGSFSWTVQINTPRSGSSTISAQVVADWWGTASNLSYTYITWTGSGGGIR